MRSVISLSYVALLALLLASCGDGPAPTASTPAVPAWAKVAPEQIAEAEKHGVPVAFENDTGMRFVLIPAGTFLMGSKDPDPETFDDPSDSNVHPRHEVVLSTPYYLQPTEVTNSQYEALRPLHTARYLDADTFGSSEQPAVGVSHVDARLYADGLTQQDRHREYRLPTEAEWEYACRAGATTRYAFGDEVEALPKYANLGDIRYENDGDGRWETLQDGHRVTAPVASYVPNAWGLYDMHGNVWEWCRDCYASRYPDGPVTDPSGPREEDAGRGRSTWTWRNVDCEHIGRMHVIRGGSWSNAPGSLTSENRSRASLEYRSHGVGFRLAADLPAQGEGVR